MLNVVPSSLWRHGFLPTVNLLPHYEHQNEHTKHNDKVS